VALGAGVMIKRSAIAGKLQLVTYNRLSQDYVYTQQKDIRLLELLLNLRKISLE